MLEAWDANPIFDFEFDSRGPGEPIDSVKAYVISSECAEDWILTSL